MGYYVYVPDGTPPPKTNNGTFQNTATGALYGLGIGALTGHPGWGAGIGALSGAVLGPNLGSQGLGLPGFRGGKKRKRSVSRKVKSPSRKRRRIGGGKIDGGETFFVQMSPTVKGGKKTPKRKSKHKKY